MNLLPLESLILLKDVDIADMENVANEDAKVVIEAIEVIVVKKARIIQKEIVKKAQSLKTTVRSSVFIM